MAKQQGAELRETTEDRPAGDFYGTVSEARISLQRTRGVLHPAGIQVHPKRTDEKVEVPPLCLQLLKKFWGFDRFLTDQAELVKLILEGDGKRGKKDVSYSLPTSGGKSLVFQLAALYDYYKDEKKDPIERPVTIVIQPLVALIRNQAASLHRKDVPFAFFHGLQKEEERAAEIQKIKDGRAALIYVSPERFITDNFLRDVLGVPDLQRAEVGIAPELNIARLVWDEAHYFDRRHRFRFGYSEKMGMILDQYFPQGPKRPQLIPCTATLPETVRMDVMESLRMTPDNTYVYTATHDRKNLTYHVEEFSSFRKKFPRVLEILKSRGTTPAVFYCPTRKSTEALAAYLTRNGIEDVEFYHAGIGESAPDAEGKSKSAADLEARRKRIEIEDRFTTGKTKVIIATNAFGEGIDIPNIRTVGILYLPKSMELLIQLGGRGGRDSLPSDVFYLIAGTDVAQAQYLLNANHAPRGFVKKYAAEHLFGRFERRTDRTQNSIYFNQEDELPKTGPYRHLTQWKRSALFYLLDQGIVNLHGRRLEFKVTSREAIEKLLPLEDEFRIDKERSEKGFRTVALMCSEAIKRGDKARHGVRAAASEDSKPADDAPIRETMQRYLQDGLPEAFNEARDLARCFPSLIRNIRVVTGLIAGKDYEYRMLSRQIRSAAKKAAAGGKRALQRSPFADFAEMSTKEIQGVVRQAEALNLIRIHRRGERGQERTILSLEEAGHAELANNPEHLPTSVRLAPSAKWDDLKNRMGSCLERKTLVEALSEWNESEYQKLRTDEALRDKLSRSFYQTDFTVLGVKMMGRALTAYYVGKDDPEKVTVGDMQSFLNYLFSNPLDRVHSKKLHSD